MASYHDSPVGSNTDSPKLIGKKGSSSSVASGSPKGGASDERIGVAMCLCSPTKHRGSFRCRYHRSSPPSAPWMKRSMSMPANKTAVSPK